MAAPQLGTILTIWLETLPDLTGVAVAIGGGPALVRDGKPMHWNGFLHMRHPRTALGWNKDNIFLVEVDGRQSNISLGMTFPELADYLIKIGCSEAMNLDGGGSATLWALGSVRNSPSEGEERPSANALVVVRKTSNSER
jgi:exopolysaccharide biosynthesis protein